jgi:hypothetical protein
LTKIAAPPARSGTKINQAMGGFDRDRERDMDVAAMAAAFVGMQAARTQMEVAAKMLKMSNDSQKSALQLLDAGQGNAQSSANAALGLGQNLDITV